MQTSRLKSQLSLLIIIIFMLIIIIIAPVNHRFVLPISANTNNNNIIIRKVSLKSTNTNIPSSFLVVQKSRNEGSGEGNLTKATLVLNINRTYNTYTNNKNQLPNFENINNSLARELNKGIDIALVAPTFTAAAYDNNSFYTFYELYANISAGRNVTSNLNLLSRKITSQDTIRASLAMLKLIDNLKWMSPYSNITILNDPDIDNGSLLNINNKNNNNIYDIVILGHQEYVTQREYDNLKKFVINGGTLILLDGNVFFAQVKYDNHTKTVSLVKGHWWAFNGKSAWPSIGERWADQTSQWVGSNYLCYQCVSTFGNDPFEYMPHEEQYITNHNDTIVINYNAVSSKIIHNKPIIATYELNYQKGKVVALGIFSDDVIDNSKFDRFFDNLLVKYAPKSGA